MRRFLTFTLAASACLALAGCGIPDAIAYGVKAAKGGSSQGPARSAEPAAQHHTAPPTAAEPEPAPLPMPVQREAIQVEQLPPP